MGSRRARRARFQAYDRFRRLDGSHPLKDRVPDGFVSYRARRVQGGRVSYFNFALAREIGLIPLDHPERMTRGLQRAILETFALQIVNEYDEQKRELIDPTIRRTPPRIGARRLPVTSTADSGSRAHLHPVPACAPRTSGRQKPCSIPGGTWRMYSRRAGRARFQPPRSLVGRLPDPVTRRHPARLLRRTPRRHDHASWWRTARADPRTGGHQRPFERWEWDSDGRSIAGSADGIVILDLANRRDHRLMRAGVRPIWESGGRALHYTNGGWPLQRVGAAGIRTVLPTRLHPLWQGHYAPRKG